MDGHRAIATTGLRQAELKERWGVELLAPPKRRGRDEEAGWSRWLTQKRRPPIVQNYFQELHVRYAAV